MQAIRYITFCLFIALLSACAQKPVLEQPATGYSYISQLDELALLDTWEVTGRVSIQTADDAFTASIKWRKLVDYQLIELTGTLGQSYVTMEVTPELTTLTIQDEEPVSSTNPEVLMFQRLGFVIPVTLLTDWIKGYPDMAIDQDIKTGPDGFIESISYDNWQVGYRKYRSYKSTAELFLPSRLQITNGTENIKLAVKTWQKL